jgi:hypothetical protein
MVTRNDERVTCHLQGLDQQIVVPALMATSATSSPEMLAMHLEFYALSTQLSPRLDGVALEWLVLPKNR